MVIFTCATSRAVHLELTHSQTAKEFQEILNTFIAIRTRPRRIICDNATVFKATASWIKKIRRSERLQNYLATHEIHWTFNLAKLNLLGGEESWYKSWRKPFTKPLGQDIWHFTNLRIVIILDIERNMNNRPLTYVESCKDEQQVLTPNLILWWKMHTC